MKDCICKDKIEYYILRAPDIARKWCYSARRLKTVLEALLAGQQIKSVYVNLESYLHSEHNGDGIIDLTYMGGASLILFEKTAIEIAFCATGMAEYRIFPIWDIKLRRTRGFPPYDRSSYDNCFFDLADRGTSVCYAEKPVTEVEITGTGHWSILNDRFDESKARAAAENNDLPAEIILGFDEGRIIFESSEFENYRILLESCNRQGF